MTMMNLRALACLTGLALNSCGSKPAPESDASTGTAASTASNGTPESAARVFAEALRSGDFAAAARAMHPSALHQFRTLFQPMLSAPKTREAARQMFGMTLEQLAVAPDTVLFAALLKTMLAQEEGLADAMRSATIEPLGHVARGDTMLVVTRTTIAVEGVSMTQFDVMPFILDDGQWWGLLKADLTNLAAMMNRAVNEQS
jgi:hypothetical protein